MGWVTVRKKKARRREGTVLQVRRQAVGCCFYCSGSVLLYVCVCVRVLM